MTEDRTMNINGIGLQIREMGPPDGHAIALVAGWAQTLHAWRLAQPKLASQGFRVIAIDPLGIGGSDMLPDGSLADTGTVAGFMTALIKMLEIREFTLVGHDIGAWISYAWAVFFGGFKATVPDGSRDPWCRSGHNVRTPERSSRLSILLLCDADAPGNSYSRSRARVLFIFV